MDVKHSIRFFLTFGDSDFSKSWLNFKKYVPVLRLKLNQSGRLGSLDFLSTKSRYNLYGIHVSKASFLLNHFSRTALDK